MTTREVNRHDVTVDGRTVGVLERGAGDDAVVFLHGGTPAVSPYVGCADHWRPLLEAMPGDRRLVAIDLPGAGRSTLPEGADGLRELLVGGTAARVAAVIDALGIGRATIVSHGEGSLAAFLLARQAREGLQISGVMAIAPLAVAPTGDAGANLTLLNPPQPLWTCESQRWALSRLVERIDVVTSELVDIETAFAQGRPHLQAVDVLRDAPVPGSIQADRLAARAQFNAYCRETGYDVPISLVWGAVDPLLNLDVGRALFAILATTGAHLELNVVNRTGHFPALEDPAAVIRLLDPFLGLTSTR